MAPKSSTSLGASRPTASSTQPSPKQPPQLQAASGQPMSSEDALKSEAHQRGNASASSGSAPSTATSAPRPAPDQPPQLKAATGRPMKSEEALKAESYEVAKADMERGGNSSTASSAPGPTSRQPPQLKAATGKPMKSEEALKPESYEVANSEMKASEKPSTATIAPKPDSRQPPQLKAATGRPMKSEEALKPESYEVADSDMRHGKRPSTATIAAGPTPEQPPQLKAATGRPMKSEEALKAESYEVAHSNLHSEEKQSTATMASGPSPRQPPQLKAATGRPMKSEEALKAESYQVAGSHMSREGKYASSTASSAPGPSPNQPPQLQAATGRPVPSEDELKPEVYEEGSNIGPQMEDALEVEHLDADLFRSSKPLWRPFKARGVFGGQVIGQAVAVSNASVRDDVRLHSLHSYFLLAGDETMPIYYHVSRLRDGGSYVTRLVEAKQKGRCIFVLFSSYARPEPNRPRFAIGLPKVADSSTSASQTSSEAHEKAAEAAAASSKEAEHQIANADVVLKHPSRFVSQSGGATRHHPLEGLIPWEDAPLNEDRYRRLLNEMGNALPGRSREALLEWIKDREESAVEIRDALPDMYDENGAPRLGQEQAFWVRCKRPIKGGDSEQKAALSYASDINLLGTVPKALGLRGRIKMMASLDHSMHFYEPFDFHKPMLFFMQVQVAGGGRGLVIGRFYSREGTLLGLVSQEGLVRPRDDFDVNKVQGRASSKL